MKDLSENQKLLIKYVKELDEENVIKLANQLLNDGIDPVVLLELVNEGMNLVGKLYETKDYYIADLIMAGLIFKQVLELDKVNAHFYSQYNKRNGKVVLGTVKGDIHDIGKDIFRGMLEANGFEVIDLGVDAPKELFLKKVEEHKPDIVGLSGVLTNSVDAMKEVIDAFTSEGLRQNFKFIVGGNHLTVDTCRYIAADSFANEASSGVKQCLEWVNSTGRGVNGND